MAFLKIGIKKQGTIFDLVSCFKALFDYCTMTVCHKNTDFTWFTYGLLCRTGDVPVVLILLTFMKINLNCISF